MDPLARARLWETVAAAAAAGAGMLITTHYMDEAYECDRLAIMAAGRVVARGTAAEITGDARVTVVAPEPAAAWAAAFGALEQGPARRPGGAYAAGAGCAARRGEPRARRDQGQGHVRSGHPGRALLPAHTFSRHNGGPGVTDPPEPGRRAGRASRPDGRRSGRRGGDSGTREAILAAARARFGDLGYDRATIRDIAADAGVDPALVHHFYGKKESLFVAAMRLPVNPLEILDAALAPGARDESRGLGEHLLRIVLGVWDVAEMRATFLGMLRSATTSEQAAAMLREFATGTILSRIAGLVQESEPAGTRTPSTGRRWWPARYWVWR